MDINDSAVFVYREHELLLFYYAYLAIFYENNHFGASLQYEYSVEKQTKIEILLGAIFQ